MTFADKINEDLKNAMKSGDKVRLDTLRSIRAAIIEFEKSGDKAEMTPEMEFKILNGAAKKRKDAIEMYKNANRPELLEKEEAELSIIQEYLPKMMDESEVRQFIKDKIVAIGAVGMKDMGKVMGPSMKELNGKADGSLVQKIVKELLEGS